MDRMRPILLAVVLLAPTSLALPLGPPAAGEAWVGESADAIVLRTPDGMATCLVTIVVEGLPETGYRFSLRTSADYNDDPSGCENEATIAWAWAIERAHDLPPTAGDPRAGFHYDWTVPSNCTSGHYHFVLTTEPLGAATALRYVYEGVCNDHPFSYVLQGNVDFVAHAIVPALEA